MERERSRTIENLRGRRKKVWMTTIVTVRMNATISTEQRTGIVIKVSMTMVGALMKHPIGSRNINLIWIVKTTQRVLNNGLCQFLFHTSGVTDKEKKKIQ